MRLDHQSLSYLILKFKVKQDRRDIRALPSHRVDKMGSNLSTEDVVESRPLIIQGERDFDEYSDADSKINRPFAWSEYGAFFTIGLSMMWTWYVASYDLASQCPTKVTSN